MPIVLVVVLRVRRSVRLCFEYTIVRVARLVYMRLVPAPLEVTESAVCVV